MNKRPIRVLCVDDHAFLAEGMKSRLSLESDMEIVGWQESAEGLSEEVRRRQVDVVLMDIEMPGPDVFEVLWRSRSRIPPSRMYPTRRPLKSWLYPWR